MFQRKDQKTNKENILLKTNNLIEKTKEICKQEQNQKQKELTDALINAYKSIRPTIIQAQRVLKVFENLEQKMQILRIISHDNLEKINLSDQKLCKSIADLINNINIKSKSLFDLRMTFNNLTEEKNNFEEIQDSDIDSDNFELKEIKKQLETITNKIKQLRKGFCKDVRNFIRNVQKNSYFLEVRKK